MALNKVTSEGEIAEAVDDSDVVRVYYDEMKGQTEAAVLVVIEDEEYWIPKSQIWDADLEKQSLEMKEWLATEKGFV